jgi:hypothetical protein
MAFGVVLHIAKSAMRVEGAADLGAAMPRDTTPRGGPQPGGIVGLG